MAMKEMYIVSLLRIVFLLAGGLLPVIGLALVELELGQEILFAFVDHRAGECAVDAGAEGA